MLAPGPKSLNLGYRKRETERIEQENHAFAKRLFDKQANLSKRKLEQDFKNHLKYKKQIQKVPHGKKQAADQKKKKEGDKGKTGSAEKKKEEQKEEEDGKQE